MEDIDNQYTFYGRYQFKVKVSGNTVKGIQDGPNTVEFSDGDKITFRYCYGTISGMIFGKRIVGNDGIVTIEDQKNDLYCEVKVTNSKKNGLKNYLS